MARMMRGTPSVARTIRKRGKRGRKRTLVAQRMIGRGGMR